MPARNKDRISPRKDRFIEEIVKDGNVKRASEASEVSEVMGHKYLRDPYVIEALNKVRKNSVKMAAFNADEALRQADEAIEFAIASDNANAYVKALELKSKIQGLLVDKIDLRSTVAFSIQMAPLRDAPLLQDPRSAYLEAAARNLLNEPVDVAQEIAARREEKALFHPEEDPFEGIEDDPFS